MLAFRVLCLPQVSLSSAPLMNRKHISNYVKGIMILAGVFCFGLALANLAMSAFTWGYLFMLAFSVFIGPRMSLALPRSKFLVNFSDSLIFLSFLFYGGESAIVLATLEMLASCIYLRSRGVPFGRLMIPINVSISTVTTAITYLIWLNMPKTGFFVFDP